MGKTSGSLEREERMRERLWVGWEKEGEAVRRRNGTPPSPTGISHQLGYNKL
jgi:hypothetical protein